MDEAIGYLIVGAIILYIVVLVIGAILTIGLVLMGAVAAAGAIAGFFIAAKNFFQVLRQAHAVVPR
jgi:hypothetical protein